MCSEEGSLISFVVRVSSVPPLSISVFFKYWNPGCFTCEFEGKIISLLSLTIYEMRNFKSQRKSFKLLH